MAKKAAGEQLAKDVAAVKAAPGKLYEGAKERWKGWRAGRKSKAAARKRKPMVKQQKERLEGIARGAYGPGY